MAHWSQYENHAAQRHGHGSPRRAPGGFGCICEDAGERGARDCRAVFPGRAAACIGAADMFGPGEGTDSGESKAEELSGRSHSGSPSLLGIGKRWFRWSEVAGLVLCQLEPWRHRSCHFIVQPYNLSQLLMHLSRALVEKQACCLYAACRVIFRVPIPECMFLGRILKWPPRRHVRQLATPWLRCQARTKALLGLAEPAI